MNKYPFSIVADALSQCPAPVICAIEGVWIPFSPMTKTNQAKSC
jgi:hypothetical protein